MIHTAFQHGSSDFAAAARAEIRAIRTLGETLVGSDRPFVVTSGTAGLTLVPGRVSTEGDEQDLSSPAAARIPGEAAALSFAERGVRASVVRLPPSVHGEGDHGFVPHIIAVARAKGVSAYPGDGSNRWAAGHRLDAAHLYRLALEEAPGGARLHAVGDEGVPVRDIAEAVGRYLKLPVAAVPREEAADHFGWLGHFFAMDVPASSALTRKRLGWHPERPGLVEDLEEGHYFTKS